MNISDLEKQYEIAQKRATQAARGDGDYWSASDKASALFVELAEARMKEYVKTRVFPVKDVGAKTPHLLLYKDKIAIMFYLENKLEADPVEKVALVKFKQSKTSDFRYSSNLEIRGRPLPIENLRPFTMEIVENSEWKDAYESLYESRPNYDRESWRLLKHYIVEFPAEMGSGLRVSEVSFEQHRLFTWVSRSLPMTFDCLAQSYEMEIYPRNMSDVLAEITKQIFEREERA